MNVSLQYVVVFIVTDSWETMHAQTGRDGEIKKPVRAMQKTTFKPEVWY